MSSPSGRQLSSEMTERTAMAAELAECAERVLGDAELYSLMSAAGIERMGSPGALADMTEYAAAILGWDIRQRVVKAMQNAELNNHALKNRLA